MKKQRYTVDDLSHHLRVNDIDSISKVEFALLETNGSLSIISKDECVVELPDALICDGIVDEDNLKLLNRDLNWLKKELKKQHINHIEDVFYCILEKDKLLVIKNRTVKQFYPSNILSLANSSPLASSNLRSRSSTVSFFFSSPLTS